MKSRVGFFKKLNKTDKHIAKLTKKEKIQVNKIRNEKMEISQQTPMKYKKNT
jgi:hypothetical protein